MSEIGRPSKYDPKYVNELIEFFNIEPYEEKIKQIPTKSGEVVDIMVDTANDFPTLAGFACKLGVHRDTLQEWAKVHADFSVAYKRAKEYQERYLTVNGLKGLVNGPFAIFTAKNVLGWRDKQPGENDSVNLNLDQKDVAKDSELKPEVQERIDKLLGKER